MDEVTILKSWDTRFSADSVEWCPLFPYQDYFVCGTYHLEVTTENGSENCPVHKKSGFLYLLSFTASMNDLLQQTIEMPAVLDSKWCHKTINNKILLCVANAKGEVSLFQLKGEKENHKENAKFRFDGDRPQLILLETINICREKVDTTLALSVDWSTGRSVENPQVCVSDSEGNITVLQVSGEKFIIFLQWKAHDYEAWITAFDYWCPNIIYSGGDDCKLHLFDMRTSVAKPSLSSGVHEMGVTSLHSNAYHQSLLVSGSYDEQIRLWDWRSCQRPLSLLSTGGGIWRLKWDPHSGDCLLAACMHSGFRVVYLDDQKNMTITKAFSGGHTSLAYGADWSHGEINLLAICSFYDHKLSVAALGTQK